MGALQKRIDRAWRNSKDWITEFDGSATQAYLTNIAEDALPQAVDTLARESSGLRVSTISAEDGETGDKTVRGDGTVRAEFVSPETIQDQVARLQQDEIAGLNINYSVQLDEFVVDLHMVVNTIGRHKVDLEIVWWPDQVFLEDADPYAAFKALTGYFISLQDLFKSSKLYIGPETFERPGPGSLVWVEV